MPRRKKQETNDAMVSSFMQDAEKPKAEETNWYYGFAKGRGKPKTNTPFKDAQIRDALDFLGWDLTPEQVSGATTMAFALAFLPAIVAGYLLVFHMQLSLAMLTYSLPFLVFVPLIITFYVQRYPISHANDMKMRSILEVPEIVNYMVMSMKLNSNLERAISFAAEHGTGKIAKELKEIAWNLQLGVYQSAEEALDKLAYKWGQYSDEFKHGLMLIRSSVIEIEEAKRYVILDKAVSDVLEGIRDNMDKYATQMRQPSIYLYYVGVLLPLMLIIMLPIGSVMANLPFAQTWIMVLLYNILVPLGSIVFARQILSRRPPVYDAPEIPDRHPELPRKAHIKIGGTSIPVVLVSILVFAASMYAFIYVLEPTLNPDPSILAPWDEEAIRNYVPFFTLAGTVISVSLAISAYLYGSTYPKRRLQKKMMGMEQDFQDSIYVLASRLGENRPMEEAIIYTSNFLGDSPLSKLYRATADNIRNLGMTIDEAFFNPAYGSLKDVPSRIIRDTVKIVIDSMTLGVQQGARVLISLSLQLRDAQRVRERIRSLLEEITSMMKSIAFLIAPLVLGITSALQRIIVLALSSFAGTASDPGPAVAGIPQVSFGSPEMIEMMPDSTTFLAIIAVYVIQITLLLTYFTTRIEEGDNTLALRMNLAKALPISLILFFFSAWFASKLSVV